jgi:hypothetical protein
MAIRMAMGSGRVRIVRQLLTESLLLAAGAGLSGAALAAWGVEAFSRYAPAVLWTGRTPIAAFSTPSLDARALLFVLGVTLVSSTLSGLAPALDTWRVSLTDALKENERAGGVPRRLFRSLVVIEVALAVLLLAAADCCWTAFENAAAPAEIQHRWCDFLGPATNLAISSDRRTRHS